MFVWTLSDVIVAAVLLLIFVTWAATVIVTVIRQARCKHAKGVDETQACDAICRQCGKNLGFIGAWRERNSYEP